MAKTESNFFIRFKNFYQGFSPAAHLNELTERGNEGHASKMKNVNVLVPDYITQGLGLADLTNGNQAGVVSELINFILDKAVANDETYGIGATKLFKISSTTVISDANWPHTITDCIRGESVLHLKGKVYYLFNKASDGDIGLLTLPNTFDDDWGSTVPTGKALLQKSSHPSAGKEDIMIFGNGRYLGTYIQGNDTLTVNKLDFGEDHEVADVIFHANQWYIAVNEGVSGSNRTIGQIYLYDGAAISSILDDEASIGLQRIGFLFVLNGVVFVAYQDLSDTAGYKIGYLAGRQIKPLAYFSGSLPTFAQKTLYKNTILFISGSLIYSCGAVTPEFPIQLSQLAKGGHATVGALAAPFGTPMVASSDGSANHRLAKFSGFDTDCEWRSIIVPTISGRLVGYISEIIILTRTLGANARCDLKLEYNQASSENEAKQITGTGKRRFVFNVGKAGIEDFRAFLNWANGNATNDCPIREIQISGHYTER